MSKKIEQAVEELVKAHVEGMGYELDDVEYKKEGQEFVLTVYIDKQGGVSLNDCEAVSRALDPVIEEADPIEGQYYFSVSSVGLDRPLKKPRDYERNLGKEVTVKLFAPIGKVKEFTGVLAAFDGEGLTLDTGKERLELKIKDVALAKPYINFK